MIELLNEWAGPIAFVARWIYLGSAGSALLLHAFVLSEGGDTIDDLFVEHGNASTLLFMFTVTVIPVINTLFFFYFLKALRRSLKARSKESDVMKKE